jgi:hypothetical protein
MLIDQDLTAFMESPVMIIIGSCDDLLLPQIGRAAGAVAHATEGRVDLIVSSWQWPATVANVRGNGRLSTTFARPSDYVSYQVKGRASVIPASAEHRKRAKHYIEAMTSTLVALGLDPRVAAPWFADREPVVLSLSVEAVFVQTPGDQAGQTLERRP